MGDKPSSNIVHLVTQVGEGYHADVDAVLDGAKGKLKQVLIIGWEQDDTVFLAASEGDAQNLLLLELAKRTLIDGYFED